MAAGERATTVRAWIRHLMPNGSNPLQDKARKRPSWSAYPIWPPDAFAVAATLVENSGCYTLLGRSKDNGAFPGLKASMPALLEIARGWRFGSWYHFASGDRHHSKRSRLVQTAQERTVQGL